jgi:chromosome segregation ATPase
MKNRLAKRTRETSDGMGLALGISALFNIGQAFEVGEVRAQRNAERYARIVAEARAANEEARAQTAEASLRTTQNDLANKEAQCGALLSDVIEARKTSASLDREVHTTRTTLANVRQELSVATRRAASAEERAATAEARATTAEARVRELEAELARRPPSGDA